MNPPDQREFARTRVTGRGLLVLAGGVLGTIVMVQRCGVLDLSSCTDRTWPVTELTVVVLPLNCTIRKR